VVERENFLSSWLKSEKCGVTRTMAVFPVIDKHWLCCQLSDDSVC
jgi:hypothetical protein